MHAEPASERQTSMSRIPLPALPPPGEATYADIEALPEGVNGELIDGTLYVTPRPVFSHAKAGSLLQALLTAGHGLPGPGPSGPGGWLIIHEPELHFGSDVLVPDIGGWRRERLPAPVEDYPRTAPDWVCEVLSPGTARYDRGLKLERYRRNGVRHAWLVDPRERTLEVLKATEEGWLRTALYAEDETPRAEPFEAQEVALGLLWND